MYMLLFFQSLRQYYHMELCLGQPIISLCELQVICVIRTKKNIGKNATTQKQVYYNLWDLHLNGADIRV